jgi:recombination protein RecA
MGAKVQSFREALRETLDRLVTDTEKLCGRGSVMCLGSGSAAAAGIEVFPTGSIGLDRALGVGGYPKGRIVEVYGPESSGKTTICLHAIAEVQKAGGIAAFIDAEHALDVEYARKLGVSIDDLLVAQPGSGEEALQVAEVLLRSGAVALIVIDSVAALVPKAEIDGEMGDQHVGLQARLMSQALRKLNGVAHQHKATLLFINQMRQKIGVMFGSNETTTGGNALKFYASVRLDIRKIQTLKNGDEPIGARTKVKVVKNKVASPFRVAEFDLIYGRGVDRAAELLDLAEAAGIVSRSGSWYSLGEARLGQGREACLERLRGEPELRADLEARVFGVPAPTVITAEAA